ncbi:hypothetical protein V5O48_018549 [Marasmius crinis-equi]|uniref:Uncharacterized protein n=1 Tax=Marasmius crinis-equi TaxID=585013 RepID=A0ABR3EL03_9AGAR
MPKSFFGRMGMKWDLNYRLRKPRQFMLHTVLKARNLIYRLGKPIGGTAVNSLLKWFSGVPTVNAFVDRLGIDFDPCRMLVVDLMHEFELGVWKALFTHLIRILYASPESVVLVERLNKRYGTQSFNER